MLEEFTDWVEWKMTLGALILGGFILLTVIVGVLMYQREYGALTLMFGTPLFFIIGNNAGSDAAEKALFVIGGTFVVMQGWAGRLIGLFTGGKTAAKDKPEPAAQPAPVKPSKIEAGASSDDPLALPMPPVNACPVCVCPVHGKMALQRALVPGGVVPPALPQPKADPAKSKEDAPIPLTKAGGTA